MIVNASPELAASGLLQRMPEMSAFRTLGRSQAWILLALTVGLVISLAAAPLPALIAVNALCTLAYGLVLAYGVLWFLRLFAPLQLVTVTDLEARALSPSELPAYTVLVAAYHEGPVIHETIRALEALDYPVGRLEIKLLLEADDTETLEAAMKAAPAPHIEIVQVPYNLPRTKPKACNYGLQSARGELVTLFDAEDRPDPLQLRRAAAAFARLDPSVACLQARLHYHNPEQNFITRLFAAEYITWFDRMLPALPGMAAPVPLGGTSMHIRREVLERVGGWDPHNVTEDADLGVRLNRLGYRTRLLDSVTYEEANSDFINWIKQRSRWYKGYLQTWLVHMREPARLWRELGPAGFIGLNVVVGATPVVALLNPLFWIVFLSWFAGRLEIVEALFPAWVLYPAIACALLGNALALVRTAVSVRAAGHSELLPWLLLMPVYWMMMSLAAVRAFAQLLVSPWHWEKTTHGLSPDFLLEGPGK